MKLLVVRHGPAGEHWPKNDERRPLTKDGRAKTLKAMKGLAKVADKPKVLLTSSLTRAEQTADLFETAFGKMEREHVPRKVARKHLPDDYAVVVGHEPELSALIEELTGAKSGLKKAGACFIEDGRLVWLLPPAVLRKLA